MRQTNIIKIHTGYCHKNMLKDLEALKCRYPELEIINIGQSVLARSIPAVRLGTGPKQLHYNGSIHANEWITTLLLMVFIERYLEANDNDDSMDGVYIPELFRNKSLWIVPMVNPDGVELVQNGFTADNPFYREVLQANKESTNFRNWKANIRGVDLNDQFPAHWEREYNRRETNEPAPLNYPGPFPLSEPEAQALVDFTEKNDFKIVIAFHTQGEEIYWGYEGLEPPESQPIIKRLQKASGYKAVRYVASDAGFKDWFIYRWRRPGFTVECGRGQNPLPLSQFWSIWPKASTIMLNGLFSI
jgi:g-D-glutamyl-meso-diaminopimelate peptidase